ncbi:MAG: DUF2256 domain-containing protein [Candidatus Nanopelagicales bacterium]
MLGHVPRDLPTKTCAGCGRTMTWRKAWARTWDDVRWCSDACRARGRTDRDAALEAQLLHALQQVRRGSLLDPEQVLHAADRERVRSAARRLAADGSVEVVQSGRVVDPSHARGPMHVRLAR